MRFSRERRRSVLSMSKEYPIIDVKSEWISRPEEMGSKEKFWHHLEDDAGSQWLFKHPQKNTGQHWTEKVAAEIALILDIDHAIVELATHGMDRGSTTRSFISEGVSLHHGNQLLEAAIGDYDKSARYHQANHTLSNIWRVLDGIFVDEEAKFRRKVQFSSYLVLDALIGNTDRHHENWGILLCREEDQWKGRLAPSFDHASSLGRELLDEKRRRILADDRVPNYSERGRGAIYWQESDARGLSPLNLVRRGSEAYADVFRPSLTRLLEVKEEQLAAVVDPIPSSWISEPSSSFAVELMCYNLNQLQKLVG